MWKGYIESLYNIIVMYLKQHGCKGLVSKLNYLTQATAARFSIARL